jgi:hypothetical protein
VRTVLILTWRALGVSLGLAIVTLGAVQIAAGR